jgi:hypothetical protein
MGNKTFPKLFAEPLNLNFYYFTKSFLFTSIAEIGIGSGACAARDYAKTFVDVHIWLYQASHGFELSFEFSISNPGLQSVLDNFPVRLCC